MVQWGELSVHPWRHGEWRVLGAGLALNKEFGKYLEFRNKLPDTAANLIDRNKTLLTICLSTAFVAKTRKGSRGYQFAYIFNPKRLPGFDTSRYQNYIDQPIRHIPCTSTYKRLLVIFS